MSEPTLTSQMVPRWRGLWFGLIAASVVALALGALAFREQLRHGLIISGLRTPGVGGASWGLHIAFYVFFVGVSFAGIAVSSIARLMRIEVLKPITRIAELLTIVSLVSGACIILADLGRPLDGLLKLPRYARPWSPFFGTFTLVVSGYLFSSLVYFFLAGRHDAATMASEGPRRLRWLYRLWASGYRGTEAEKSRHHRNSFFLSLTILPLLVIAHSTLGFIFGLQSGRPGWFGGLQAPAFVVMAGVSGTGMVILVTLGLRALFSLHDRIPDASIRWLGNFLWVLALCYLYFMVVEEMTASYAAPEADRHLAHALVRGRFAPIFWVTAGSLFLTFLLPFILYLRKGGSLAWLALAATLANVGAIGKRFLIVVPSQVEGVLLPIHPGSYAPSWDEYALNGGFFGLVILVLVVFARYFPIVPSKSGRGTTIPPPLGTAPRDARGWVSGLVAAVAVAMITVGLADSFRLWSGDESDPVIPFSPILFAAGVMTLFTAAVVYEVYPSRRSPAPGPADPTPDPPA